MQGYLHPPCTRALKLHMQQDKLPCGEADQQSCVSQPCTRAVDQVQLKPLRSGSSRSSCSCSFLTAQADAQLGNTSTCPQSGICQVCNQTWICQLVPGFELTGCTLVAKLWACWAATVDGASMEEAKLMWEGALPAYALDATASEQDPPCISQSEPLDAKLNQCSLCSSSLPFIHSGKCPS